MPAMLKSVMKFDPNVLVAVDFDGTITKEDTITNTEIEINRMAVAYLKLIQKAGAKLILWTCRENKALEEAVQICSSQELFFDYINTGNKKRPDSRKINADVYIDERNYPKNKIPWEEIYQWIIEILKERGIR